MYLRAIKAANGIKFSPCAPNTAISDCHGIPLTKLSTQIIESYERN